MSEIREANPSDAASIRHVDLEAFDQSEAQQVADLAVDLLNEESPIPILSLVALQHDKIVAHISFSPVSIKASGAHVGYILAPLAVLPECQRSGVGSALVQHGLDAIAQLGPCRVFVYGDPQYYARFGFRAELAKAYPPEYVLTYPEGWHALTVGTPHSDDAGTITCVTSLNDPTLW